MIYSSEALDFVSFWPRLSWGCNLGGVLPYQKFFPPSWLLLRYRCHISVLGTAVACQTEDI